MGFGYWAFGLGAALALLTAAIPAGAQEAPADFTRFTFAGHEREADTLNRYLWYHFHNRLGNGKTLFNKEYLAVADLWLSDALDQQRNKPIQEVHREDLSGIRIDPDGYVNTHQHFSYAHDHGWPFPLWTQSGQSPDEVAGRTAGWHFQEDGKNWMWLTGYLKGWNRPQYFGAAATRGWDLQDVRSLGIVDDKSQLEAIGPNPTITTPAGMAIDAFNSPYLQLRWVRLDGKSPTSRPYVEWIREGDTAFGEDRRVYFDQGSDEWQHVDGTRHSLIPMYQHPKWKGKIAGIRIALAPGESAARFGIDSFFTVYDTRHTINNPIFILACWEYFRWTGDREFLAANIDRMRQALRFQQTELGGLKYNHIRVPWQGHGGLPGWVKKPDGSKKIHPGQGIGNNYWDIMPFGGDDMYATNQYHASLIAMGDAEEAIRKYPEWQIPTGPGAFLPTDLRRHAAAVRRDANARFWNPSAGRFVGCIDTEGKPHDYGFTFLNLDSIWYGVANPEHARSIMHWLSGKRIVAGDTSTGADIYHWRFGPRATTLRNVEWYSQGWTAPESIPFGGQVQDGGAVLGFSFYDLWARLKVLGPDDAWNRLQELLTWQQEADAAGGYRKFYADGKQGTTLQGGGTAGGIGIDAEFFESSLVPSIVTYGFLGLNPQADRLEIRPALPTACPKIGIQNLLYHGVRMDVLEDTDRIEVTVRTRPSAPLHIFLPAGWTDSASHKPAGPYTITYPGTYRFGRK